ncbi:MAG: hypothetical protein GY716_09825 [bacterium]|nr:hypothetical protein [bacterium]
MYLRCADCKSARWIEEQDEARGASVGCKRCGREHSLARARDVGVARADRFRAARDFADAQAIDLPSAYTILLGLMTLEQSSVLPDGCRLDERAEVPFAEPSSPFTAPHAPGPDETPYDPAFQPAIEEGLLTAQQACERGERAAWAGALATRHDLPETLALDVADSRMALRRALLLRARYIAEKNKKPAARGAWKLWAAIAAAVAIAVPLGLKLGAPPDATPPVLSDVELEKAQRDLEREAVAEAAAEDGLPDGLVRALRSAKVMRDDAGHVLQVEAGDPRSALIAYCRAMEPELSLSPLELTQTTPPSPGAKLGIVEKAGGELQAVRIRQNRRSRRWFVGQGVRPVTPREAPTLAPDRQRVPIDLDGDS